MIRNMIHGSAYYVRPDEKGAIFQHFIKPKSNLKHR